jgi:hypothetical protein
MTAEQMARRRAGLNGLIGFVGCAMRLPKAGGRGVKRPEARPTRDRSDQQLDVLQQKEIDNFEII